jgi:hypothetical protein
MPTFPTATTLTAAQLTGATVVPLSKATARNEATLADILGAGTVNRLAIYDSDGKLTNAAFTVSTVARNDIAQTFNGAQTLITNISGNGSSLIVKNTNISGYSEILLQSSGGGTACGFGYGNASAAVFVSTAYLYTGGANFNISLDTGSTVAVSMLSATRRFGINCTPLAQLHVAAKTATDIGAIVQGFASQSANLQEWQNSSSTPLLGVSSVGTLKVINGIWAGTSSDFSTRKMDILGYSPNLNLADGVDIKWESTTNISGAPDSGITRSAINTLKVTNGSSGLGNLVVGTTNIGTGTTILQVLSASATLDFGSIAAGTSADLTISVTGAAVGDSVCVGTPAAPDANTTIFGFVSATDTVTVRVVNNQLVGAIDPASGTYRATVLRF